MSQLTQAPSQKKSKQAQSIFPDEPKLEQPSDRGPNEVGYFVSLDHDEQGFETHLYPLKNWSVKDPYRTQIPKDGEHWEACFKKVQRLDDEVCQGWRDEIDTMLIFAGLFSATVTAFVVESYQWLQDVDTPSDILARLQLQKMFDGAIPPNLQSSPAVNTLTAASINALWFSSLTLALGCALVGILCKQWLREYLRYEDLGGRQSFPIRDMRYKGLHGWHVPLIIEILPLLLQAALVLFFVGILILLWTLHIVVAGILSAIIGLILIFLVATTLLPVIQWRFGIFGNRNQCAFKSPQSWWFIHPINPKSNWTGHDKLSTTLDPNHLVSGLKRFYHSFSQDIGAIRSMYRCISDLGSEVTPSDIIATIQDNTTTWVVDKASSLGTETYTQIDEERIKRDITLCFFSTEFAINDIQMFHRNAEHCVRLLDDAEITRHPEFISTILETLGQSITYATELSRPLEWNTAVAPRLITVISSMFRNDKMPSGAVLKFWDEIFRSLRYYGSRHRYTLKPSPYSLFDDIGPWLLRRPTIDLKMDAVSDCLFGIRSIVVSEEVNRPRPDELEKVKSLVLVIDKLCSEDPITYAFALQDLKLLRGSLNQPIEPQPLYSIRKGLVTEH